MYRIISTFWPVLILAVAAPADEPNPKPAATELTAAEKVFFDMVNDVHSRMSKADAFSVSVESKWTTTGGKKELSGTNTVKLVAQKPGKVRIEVGVAGEKDPHLCLVCDGKTLNRCFHSAQVYSVCRCEGDPLTDVQADGITIPALRASGVDFLARPDMARTLAAQILSVEPLGEEEQQGHGFRLGFASGRVASVRFSKGKNPVPVEIRTTNELHVGEKKKLTHTMVSTLKWEFGVKPSADEFKFTPPKSSKQVDDLFEAVYAPDLHELVGNPAPAVEFTGTDGKAIKLADLKGKPVLVYAWALWAAPSVDSLPGLAKFVNEYEAKGVTFLAVNVGDTPDAVKEFVAQAKFTGKVALDPLGTALGQLRAQTVPAVVVIDSDGKVAAYHRGKADTVEKVKGELDKLLK